MLASPNSPRRRRNCGLQTAWIFFHASDHIRPRTFAGAFAGGVGVSCFFRRGQQDLAAPLGFAVVDRRGGRRPPPWPGCGVTVVLQQAAISRASARFSSTQSRSQPRQHRQQAPTASPRKESTLETPADPLPPLPVPRRESPVVVVTVLSGRPCRQARTAVPPHCLCRLSPCPVGFVQNPFVYRAKLNTAASGRIYRFDCPTSSTRVVRPNGFGRYIDRRYPTPRIGHHAPRMSMRLLFGIEDKR